VRDEGGVAGEGRVVGAPTFHSWGKCTMRLTNINSDWMSNASSGLCINLFTVKSRASANPPILAVSVVWVALRVTAHHAICGIA